MWLVAHGLYSTIEDFIKNRINGKVLLSLSKRDIDSFVTDKAFGVRRQLFLEIRELRKLNNISEEPETDEILALRLELKDLKEKFYTECLHSYIVDIGEAAEELLDERPPNKLKSAPSPSAASSSSPDKPESASEKKEVRKKPFKLKEDLKTLCTKSKQLRHGQAHGIKNIRGDSIKMGRKIQVIIDGADFFEEEKTPQKYTQVISSELVKELSKQKNNFETAWREKFC